jgi:RNase P/RNase MRP subunit POP5
MARRYMLVKVVCERKLTDQGFRDAMIDSVMRYFGELGFSHIDPKVVKFDANSSTAIVSCDRSATSEFESSMTLITGRAEMPMSFLVLRVSGTIKGVTKELR